MSGDGYVAAAYLVFFAIVLVYVVIMATRLSRLERDLTEINREADRRDAQAAPEREPARVG